MKSRINELKILEKKLGIYEDNYAATTDADGNIVSLSFHDDQGDSFYCTGDLMQAVTRFVHLKSLDVAVSDYIITDLSGLAALTHLEHLCLDEDCCKVDDIEALAGLTYLKHLTITNAGINSITPLKNLKALVTLNLPGNNIDDIEVLKGHTELVTVNLGYNQLRDASALAQCRGMKNLMLENNQVSDLSFVQKFPALEGLRFEDNQVKDIAFLKPLLRLKWLWIGGNPIADVMPIAGLNELMGLHMANIPVNNLAVLQPLTGLINLSAGPVKNFNGALISKFTELKTLRLLDCGISDVEFLKPLTTLYNINLDNNAIDDLKMFAELPVVHISLKNNRIAQPFPLHYTDRWHTLNLTGNIFGNRLYEHLYYSGDIDKLYADTADYWFNLGDYDKALAYYYIDVVSKKTLQIYYWKLLLTDAANDYFRLYYVIRCVHILTHLKEEDEDIFKIRNDIAGIVRESRFFNREQLLSQLQERGQTNVNYLDYSEYAAYLNENANAELNPEMLVIVGRRQFYKPECLDEALSIYEQLCSMKHPLHIALYKSITKTLRDNLGYNDENKELRARCKAILLHPAAHDVPFFDTTRWFKERFSDFVHDKLIQKKPIAVTPKLDPLTGRVERTYPEVNYWRIVIRVILALVILLQLLRGCR